MSPEPTVRLTPELLEAHAREWTALSDLIGRIYDCALDPGLWDDTLTMITSTLGPPDWQVAFLVWERFDPGGARFVGTTGLDPLVREIYAANFAGRNPWSRNIARQPLGKVVDTYEIMPLEELTSHPIYQGFFKTWGIDRAVGVQLDRQGPERLALVVPGVSGQDLTGIKRGLRLLAPHLQRAVRISEALGEANLRARAAESALDRAAVAAVTLRADRSIVTANAKARALARTGAISLDGGRFRFRDRAGQEPLAALIEETPPASAAFTVEGADGAPLPILGARIETQLASSLSGDIEGAAVILTLGFGLGGAPLLHIDRLAAWFGLTPTEARLASALAAGDSLTEYAQRRSVSVNAARFLLKGVFRKTGVGSQAQLVAALHSLPLD